MVLGVGTRLPLPEPGYLCGPRPTFRDAGVVEHGLEGLVCLGKRGPVSRAPLPAWHKGRKVATPGKLAPPQCRPLPVPASDCSSAWPRPRAGGRKRTERRALPKARGEKLPQTSSLPGFGLPAPCPHARSRQTLSGVSRACNQSQSSNQPSPTSALNHLF